jgi:hypothetical protein
MDSKSDKPLRLFVNPFAIWTQLAFKTGEAMWASAHAAALRANARRVAVIPTADAPPPKAKSPVRQASKAARFKASRTRLRSKATGKRRAKR